MLRKSEEKIFLKKHQFFCKNLLTNGKVSDIISKVTHPGDDRIKNRKKNIEKNEKSFKKGIDKRIWMWYNIKVAARAATTVIEN